MRAWRAASIPGYLLIRIPGPTELRGWARLCEMSLQSERKTLDLLEQECTRQDKPHAVIIMADLGDLREATGTTRKWCRPACMWSAGRPMSTCPA
ncbi:MAG: hypothetical protein ACLU38_00760 [Dysosmobacter sp.]